MEHISNDRESIVLGSGCFWCTEAIFKRVPGVLSVVPGYAGGTTPDPTYEEVCTGKTGHVEVVNVEYDSSVMPLPKILDVFFATHDPTSMDKQGSDTGSQYRSIIFYTKDEQLGDINRAIIAEEKKLEHMIVTQVKRLHKFYPAERYHHDYYAKNPSQPYCLFVIRPKLKKLEEHMGR